MTSPQSDPGPGRPVDGGGPSVDYSLLPPGRTFGQAAPAFVLPYFAYVALGSVPDVVLRSLLRLVATGGLLLFFRRSYRFGPPSPGGRGLRGADWAWMLGGAAAATALWIVALRLCWDIPWGRAHREAALGAASTGFAPLYLALRGLNSAILVPVFEEQLCRVYIPEVISSARGDKGWVDSRPRPLERPPTALAVSGGAALFFAFGHDVAAMGPALLYFVFTGWIYARTRNFRVVVGIHGIVNLAIAILAAWKPEFRFLWA